MANDEDDDNGIVYGKVGRPMPAGENFGLMHPGEEFTGLAQKTAIGGGMAKPGTYGAKGDPYAYTVNDDGSITLTEGPTGKGVTLRKGTAFDAIMKQITDGVLSAGTKPRELNDDEKFKQRGDSIAQQREEHLDDALASLKPEGVPSLEDKINTAATNALAKKKDKLP